MPTFLIQLLLMLAGGKVASLGSTAIRSLLGGGAKSLTSKVAANAAKGAAGSGVGKAIDAGLSGVRSKMPEAIGTRMNTGWAADQGVRFGGEAAKMGMFMGGMGLAEEGADALGLLGGEEDGYSMAGWENFQGQMNPGAAEQEQAISAVQERAQMDNLQRAMREILAEKRDMGGLY